MAIDISIPDIEFDPVQEREKILGESTEEAFLIARKRAPVDTGRLQGDIQKEGHSIYNTVPYAPIVHDGTAYQLPRRYIENAMIEVADRKSD